ncbi:hypothetical protein C7M84_018784 [Penaeus vannamei]|uniref:Uncharacterized protein n=1 Tax=Penaeus vannamei TaxID=6689 RepID=A0A3R7LSL4_PENVA|nr:hypothetical protein C7M84_018784 [Penaeus vannamei]
MYANWYCLCGFCRCPSRRARRPSGEASACGRSRRAGPTSRPKSKSPSLKSSRSRATAPSVAPRATTASHASWGRMPRSPWTRAAGPTRIWTPSDRRCGRSAAIGPRLPSGSRARPRGSARASTSISKRSTSLTRSWRSTVRREARETDPHGDGRGGERVVHVQLRRGPPAGPAHGPRLGHHLGALTWPRAPNNIDEKREAAGPGEGLMKEPPPPVAPQPPSVREDYDSSATASADEGQSGAGRDSPEKSLEDPCSSNVNSKDPPTIESILKAYNDPRDGLPPSDASTFDTQDTQCEGLDLSVRKRDRSPPPKQPPAHHAHPTHFHHPPQPHQPHQSHQPPPPPAGRPLSRDLPLTVRGGAELTITNKEPPPQAHSNSTPSYSKPPSHEPWAYADPRNKSPSAFISDARALPHPASSIMTNAEKPLHVGSITHGTPVNPPPIVSVPITQPARFDMMPKSGMGKEGGSITQGTPMHHEQKRISGNLYKDVVGVVYEPRPGSGVEIIPRPSLNPQYEREHSYRGPRPPISSAPPTTTYPYTNYPYATRPPYSESQISSRQIIANDYITSQQMHGRRAVSEKEALVSPAGGTTAPRATPATTARCQGPPPSAGSWRPGRSTRAPSTSGRWTTGPRSCEASTTGWPTAWTPESTTREAPREAPQGTARTSRPRSLRPRCITLSIGCPDLRLPQPPLVTLRPRLPRVTRRPRLTTSGLQNRQLEGFEKHFTDSVRNVRTIDRDKHDGRVPPPQGERGYYEAVDRHRIAKNPDGKANLEAEVARDMAACFRKDDPKNAQAQKHRNPDETMTAANLIDRIITQQINHNSGDCGTGGGGGGGGGGCSGGSSCGTSGAGGERGGSAGGGGGDQRTYRRDGEVALQVVELDKRVRSPAAPMNKEEVVMVEDGPEPRPPNPVNHKEGLGASLHAASHHPGSQPKSMQAHLDQMIHRELSSGDGRKMGGPHMPYSRSFEILRTEGRPLVGSGGPPAVTVSQVGYDPWKMRGHDKESGKERLESRSLTARRPPRRHPAPTTSLLNI